MITANVTPTQRKSIERSRAFHEAIAARAVPQAPAQERPKGVKGYYLINQQADQDLKPQAFPAEPDPPAVRQEVCAMEMEAIVWPVIPAERSRENRRLFIDEIIFEVATYFGIRRSDILSENRTIPFVRPRHIAIYLACEHTERSTLFVGRRFRRDHSTVLHAHKKVKNALRTDESLAFDVAQLTWRITGVQQ